MTIKEALAVVSSLARRHHHGLLDALADVIPRMSQPKFDALFELVAADRERRDREFEALCAEFSDEALGFEEDPVLELLRRCQDAKALKPAASKRPPIDPDSDPSTWF